MDVTRQASIDAGFAEAIGALGKLDILINNAAHFTAAPIAEITRADYDRAFAVNTAAPFFCMQAAARHLIARGTGCHIIKLEKQDGWRGQPLGEAYCTRKEGGVYSGSGIGGEKWR